MSSSKEQLIENLKATVLAVQDALKTEIENVGRIAFKTQKEINQLKKEDREHARHMRGISLLRLEDLKIINKSPFFAKSVITLKSIDVRLNKEKTIYFGKYEFSDKNIYSWIAPIATIRFESPGKAQFRLPSGVLKNVDIHEKEQYMIVDGKVMFYSRETEEEPRQLIYQEHFSIKKGAFMLPEIVEVMEKAQDDVIRASHVGPFAISGPAGSGKTTLALHRVAYLAQSPETAELYSKDKVIVFVQDGGTREYFSHLLPELGIHEVRVTTFFEWAKDILLMDQISYQMNTEFEFEKLSIKSKLLMAGDRFSWKGNIFTTLSNVYSQFGSDKLNKSFKEQKEAQIVDRIDVTIALIIFKSRFGQLEVHTESNKIMRMGKVVTRKQKNILKYSLIVVDEFQNYMPEQLELLRSCVDDKTQSIVYVGDLAQKVQHGTINEWNDFGESIEPHRQIKLYKVYRNTKEILHYINGLGYNVDIPENLKNGPKVVEKIFMNKSEYEGLVINYLKELVIKNIKKNVSIGIIGMTNDHVAFIRHDPEISQKNVRISTIAEAQGVEFDIVCIVGIHTGIFAASEFPAHETGASDVELKRFNEERKRIFKDLMYIGLTRAMQEMYVLGTVSLETEIKKTTSVY